MPSANRREDAILALDIGALRFIQSAPTPRVYTDAAPAFAAVRKLWWSTRWEADQMGAGLAPEALAALCDGSVQLLAEAEHFL